TELLAAIDRCLLLPPAPSAPDGDSPLDRELVLDPQVVAELEEDLGPSKLIELVDLFLADLPPRLERLRQVADDVRQVRFEAHALV
ncbi:hypothetical protein ABTM70_20110, partial [Acinetobacter baumannii]